MKKNALSVSATLVLGLVVACGSETTHEFEEGLANRDGGVNGSGDGSPQFNGNDGGGTLSDGSVVGLDRDAACAASTVAAKPGVSYVVFQFDRSGSMGKSTDPLSKLSRCKKSLENFFLDGSVKGFNASLSVFPKLLDGEPTCDIGDNAIPENGSTMQALPSQALATAAAAIVDEGGTPTIAALRGAHQYAEGVSAAHGGAKVALVLVTDGDPTDCEGSFKKYPKGTADTDALEVADFAATIKDKYPTYVIGIGKQLTKLDLVSQAGAGRAAILVDTADPNKVTADFLAALKAIQAETISCDMALPQAGAGQVIDFGKINVLFTPSGGKESTLGYDPTCANGAGWKYDNAGAPTKMVLCPATCKTIQTDPLAKVELLLGCKTGGNGSLQ
ncbi:MAG: VWA domain-containing protein [Polyangiaceae bacterium]|nr:VWA domain-containing protein [Polyangiaceae bacterium]